MEGLHGAHIAFVSPAVLELSKVHRSTNFEDYLSSGTVPRMIRGVL